mgnify:CR=1 FL=1
MIITSMNMYEFSEKNNREMGILIEANSDKQIYDKAVVEAESILKASKYCPINFKQNLTSLTILRNLKLLCPSHIVSDAESN